MKTLLDQFPKVYLVDQQSSFYQNRRKVQDETLLLKAALEKEFDFGPDLARGGDSFYLEVGSASEAKYEKELKKKKQDGYREFKKTSPNFKRLIELKAEICVTPENPFDHVDEFGLGHVSNQFVGDEWYFGTHNKVAGHVSVEVKPQRYLLALHNQLCKTEDYPDVVCDCGGVMEATGKVYNASPALFEYACTKCEDTTLMTIERKPAEKLG